MWRYLVGAAGALLLAGGGLALWKNSDKSPTIASASSAQAATSDPVEQPPAASEKTREEKRFGRYDKDRNGKVSREEFLATRRKAWARLDVNGDGKLDFDEWSVKTADRFTKADSDKSATLTADEFATTRIPRKAARPAPCVSEGDG